jgi:hypothetical protein
VITAELYFAQGSDDPAGFRVSGHTGTSGQSVVCAAVSSACYMAANTITEILGVDADVSVCDGYMSVIVDGDGIPKSKAILEGLRLHLEQLADQYPKQIKLNFLEVHQ